MTLLLHGAKLEVSQGVRDDIQISHPALLIMATLSVPSTGTQVSNTPPHPQLSPNQLPGDVEVPVQMMPFCG